MNIFYVAYVDLDAENADTRHVFEVVENLHRFGHRVRLFAPRFGVYGHETPIRIIRVPVLKMPVLTPLFFQFSLLAYLFFYFFKDKPGIIYTRSMPLEFMHSLFSRIIGCPHIVEVNGVYVEEARMEGASFLKIQIIKVCEAFSFRLASKIIVVAEGMKKALSRMYSIPLEKMVVIPNGVDVQRVKPRNMEESKNMLGFDRGPRYICFAGALKPWHGIGNLVKAIPLVLEKMDNVKLLIIGEGDLKSKLQLMVKELGIEKDVIFVGKVSYLKVPLYIGASEIGFCFRDKSIIASPLKLFEYMACGRPVVATRKEEFSLLEDHNAGILVDPEDSTQVADVIVKLLQDGALRQTLGGNGRRLVEERYTWESAARQVESVLFDSKAASVEKVSP